MIFAAFFGVAALQAQEPMKWVGEVKSFAYYITRDCMPSDRLYTIYAARKTFEDGSTVTLVRSVPLNPRSTARAVCSGEGFIERDASGAATKIVTRMDIANGGGTANASEFSLDPKTGALVGWGALNGSFRSQNVVLPERRQYLLDPFEGFAFSSMASMGSGWLFPSATYGYTDGKSKVVGLRLTFSAPTRFGYRLAGKRGLFQKMDIVRHWIGSTIAKGPEPAGSLLFNDDGTLAAYSPLPGVERLPGSVHWEGIGSGTTRPDQLPPFELKGQLAKAWEDGPTSFSNNLFALNAVCGVFIPTPTSAAEQSSLLAAIPGREKPVEQEKPGDGSGW